MFMADWCSWCSVGFIVSFHRPRRLVLIHFCAIAEQNLADAYELKVSINAAKAPAQFASYSMCN